jgi:hypothetical protein
MNTTLTTLRHRHPPDTVAPAPRPVRRVGLLDRIALRVGVALVTWSRRPLTAPTREEQARRLEQQLDNAARARVYERNLLLNTIVR